MWCKICCALIVFSIAVGIYFAYSIFDIFTKDVYSPMSHCKKIETKPGPEDFQIFDNHIVTGYADRITYKKRGGMLLINENGKVKELRMEGYPEQRSFNPIGLHIVGTTLYIINVDIPIQKDCIEVFEFDKGFGKLQLVYKKTIRLRRPYFNQLNDIFFVSEKVFYTSIFRSVPGFTSLDLFTGLKYILTRGTNLLKCNTTNDLADCIEVDSGRMFNGLAERKGELFAIDTISKTVNIYKINKDYSLTILEEIDLGISGDNIIYDEKKDKFYIGVFRLRDFIGNKQDLAEGKKPHIPGGVAELYLENGKWKSKLLFMQNVISGLSSSIRLNKNLIMGSWVDNHILVCPLE